MRYNQISGLKEPPEMTLQENKPGMLMLGTPKVEDQTFALRDGHYCIVDGRVFGTWPDQECAVIGMLVEQRRAAARKVNAKLALRTEARNGQ
jgi:hypothetical protein